MKLKVGSSSPGKDRVDNCQTIFFAANGDHLRLSSGR